MIVNAPGADFERGEEVSAYLSPASNIEPDTGTHRIVFLILKQLNGRIEIAHYDEFAIP